MPGRLCLFGEHSDWAGFHRSVNSEIVPGAAVVTGIEHGIYASAQKCDKFVVNVQIEGYENCSFESPMILSDLKSTAQSGGFFSYVAGVASLMKENYRVGGLRVDVTRSTLPLKKGLSSSAAICVLVARAFNRIYDLRLSTLGEMEIAYRGEIRTPSRCGRLDQACAFGKRPVLMTFDSGDIEVQRLRVGAHFYFVFADLMAKKDTVKILADLNRCYPFAETEVHKQVHEALGKDNRAIIDRAVELLANGDAPLLGALMKDAQVLFDKKIALACPTELTAPNLHKILNDAKVGSLTFGGKGVGSQGDGTVQFLAKDEQSQTELKNYLESLGMLSFSFTLSPQKMLRKAIIPVAGFGTRLYPATKVVKKEFLPVIDKDGVAKPAILLLIDELFSAGIEEICLVVGEGDHEWYRKMFFDQLDDEHFSKLPEQMRIYEKKMRGFWSRLKFIVQKQRLGFGHAVYQAREFSDNEPVLMVLGDQIYSSNEERSCTVQLLDAYEKVGKPMVSVHCVPLESVERYGIIAGKWENKERRCIEVSEIKEKPAREYAEQYLSVPQAESESGESCYFAMFGQYVLTRGVFEALEKNIAAMKTQGGEIQLTSALEEILATEGIGAFVPNGESYDIGVPSAYKKTVTSFGG